MWKLLKFFKFSGVSILMAIAALIAIAAAAPPPTARHQAQPAAGTRVADLEGQARGLAARMEARRTPLYHELLARTSGPQAALNRDSNLLLVGVEGGRPHCYLTDNLNAAISVGVDRLWPGGDTGLSLTGANGVGHLAVWDGGIVMSSHQEFGGRVVIGDGGAVHYHATHVGGTLVAAGVNPAAQGMSSAAYLVSYDWTDDEVEMALAAASGLLLSNHSYGGAAGWYYSSSDTTWIWWGDTSLSETEDAGFGIYTEDCRLRDEMAVNAPFYLIVKSAGNDRNDFGPDPGDEHYIWDTGLGDWVLSTTVREADGGAEGFDSIPYRGNCKNTLTVGAVYDVTGGYSQPYDVVMSSFSGWGPTDDGRIKPDLVANGISLTSTYITDDTSYAGMSGTSMSAPNAAGAIHLLVQQWRALHGGQPARAATIKAVAIHTADEAGVYDGPDFSFGWGLLNVATAGQLIADQAEHGGRIFEEQLSPGGCDTLVFYGDSAQPLSATLCWTDPATVAMGWGLDQTTPMLVHDLNLRIEQAGGDTFHPWRLDPTNPAAAAATGVNTLDNVEKVEVAAPASGTYLVVVDHSGTLAEAQSYSLVVSGLTAAPPAWADATSGPLGGDSNSIGAAWGDQDGDGNQDLFVTNTILALSSLLGNNADGTFGDLTAPPLDFSGHSHGAAWADYDNDGDLDLYVGNSGQPNILFRNDGGGTFVDAGGGALGDPGLAQTVSWADYDNDGHVDLYVANNYGPNLLLHNQSDGSFTDATGGPTGGTDNSYGLAWGDYDDDGDADLYLANSGANRLLRNNGDASFTDATSGPLGDLGDARGAAWGDYDDDGDLDLYVANYGAANRLLRNDGAGGFTDVTAPPLDFSGFSNCPAWGDFDNDGDLDLYVTNYLGANQLYQNRGDGTFTETEGAAADEGFGFGAAWADYDGDGDLDLYVANLYANKLFQNNQSTGNHWLHVDLVGRDSNRSGIGARVRLVAGGRAQTREVTAGSGYCAQNSLTLEFGLGTTSMVDSLRILWPSGTVQDTVAVAVDQVVRMVERASGSAVHPGTPTAGLVLHPCCPNPFNPQTTISFDLAAEAVVNLQIFDMAGRLTKTLLKTETVPAGRTEIVWDGRDDTGRRVASGAYFYRVQTGTQSQTRRMLSIK